MRSHATARHQQPLESAVRASIGRSLRRFAASEARRIEVKRRGSKIVLEGVAASWDEREAIVAAVAETPGVTAVDTWMLVWQR